MSQEIHVDFGVLDSGAQGINATFSQLQSTLEELESGLQPMINSWSGSAQEAYLQAKKQWDDAAQALATVLQAIGRSVDEANQNYQAAEKSAQSAWG